MVQIEQVFHHCPKAFLKMIVAPERDLEELQQQFTTGMEKQLYQD